MQAPDGTVIRVEVPDNATPDQIIAFVSENYKPKAKLTQQQKMDAGRAMFADTSATNDLSGLDKFRAGVGKSFYDIARGVSQLAGQHSREEQDQADQIDRSLMDSGAGIAGNILGHVGLTAPAALPRGAATILGGAAIGAGTGFIQPVGTEGSRGRNTMIGGVAGAAVPAAITGYKGLRSLAEPLSERGRERIVGRTIQRFADDPQNLSRAAGEIVPGSSPTLAEATLDPGLATLQRSAVSADPRLASAMSNRQLEQNAARVSALQGMGGDESAIAAAKAARDAASSPLYDAASKVQVQADQTLKVLVSRPSMKSAWERARKLAQERGETLTIGVDAPASKATTGILDAAGREIEKEVAEQSKTYSGKALHYLKLAMDDLQEEGKRVGMGANEQDALKSTQKHLVAWMDKNIPDYSAARKTYAEASKPINRMDIGNEIMRRSTGNLDDRMGNATLTPAKYANAIRDEEGVVRAATKRDLGGFDKALPQDDVRMLEAVRQDLSRSASADKLGKATGSPTAQYLSSQNLMRQMAGPMGMPQSWSESALLKSAMRPVDFAYSRAEPMVQDTLAKALLDPVEAQRILQGLITTNPEILSLLARYATAGGGPAGLLGVEAAQK